MRLHLAKRARFLRKFVTPELWNTDTRGQSDTSRHTKFGRDSASANSALAVTCSLNCSFSVCRDVQSHSCVRSESRCCTLHKHMLLRPGKARGVV